MKKTDGFTLLEIVIALLISSVIIVAISTALYRIIDTQKIVKHNADEFKSLQLGLHTLSDDLIHSIQRGSFDGVQQHPAFWGTHQEMSFSRLSVTSPMVAKYKVKNGSISRATIPYLDAKKADAHFRKLIGNIEPIDSVALFRYLGEDLLFYDAWPPPATLFKSPLPSAVQVSFYVKGRGVLTQLYLLPSASEVSDAT